MTGVKEIQHHVHPNQLDNMQSIFTNQQDVFEGKLRNLDVIFVKNSDIFLVFFIQ